MPDRAQPLQLREAVNVADLKRRDALVRRIRQLREEAVLDKNTIEYWNAHHPDESPIDSSWCDEVIAWCDGKGPLPEQVQALSRVVSPAVPAASDEGRQPTLDELRVRAQFRKIVASCTERGGCICQAANAPTCYRMIGYIEQARAAAEKPDDSGGAHG